MLSYQHGYHAGNFADVLKHLVLIEVVSYLKSKAKPLFCLDTHAGKGLYRLNEGPAQKNKEYLGGIAKLWQCNDLPNGLTNYVNLVNKFNPGQKLSIYPGSPLFIAEILTDADRLFCFELHPAEFKGLSQVVNPYKNTRVINKDGLTNSLNLLPPNERRGLVLIDPSYEIKEDYASVVGAMVNMYKKFATGCYLLWYPVVTRARNRALERALIASGMVNIQLFELGINPDNTDYGMTACGIIVVNPPWTLRQKMQEILPWLTICLGQGNHGYYRIEQLVSE